MGMGIKYMGMGVKTWELEKNGLHGGPKKWDHTLMATILSILKRF